jgi:hypothetical protein
MYSRWLSTYTISENRIFTFFFWLLRNIKSFACAPAAGGNFSACAVLTLFTAIKKRSKSKGFSR